MNSKNILTLVMVIGLAVVGFLLFQQTGDNVTFYYGVDEVEAAELGEQRVKLSGVVAADSITKDPAGTGVQFKIVGESLTNTIAIDHVGPVPDIFRDGIQVVLTGQFDAAGVFHSDELLAKCPSKYQAEGSQADFEHLNQDAYQIEYDHRKVTAPTAAPSGSTAAP